MCVRISVIEVVEFPCQAREIANTVAVAVMEAPHEDLVEDAVVPPVQVADSSAAGLHVVIPDEDRIVILVYDVDTVVAGAGELLGTVPLTIYPIC